MSTTSQRHSVPELTVAQHRRTRGFRGLRRSRSGSRAAPQGSSVTSVMGPANHAPGVSIMGAPSWGPRSDVMGGPDAVPRVSVMGDGDRGTRLNMFGDSDPSFVDSLFTRESNAR